MINQNPSQTKRSPQNVLVNSFDEDFNILAVELLGYDSDTGSLVRLKTNADGEVQLDTAALDTRYLKLDATNYESVVFPDGKYIGIDEIRARDVDGLALYDDGGNGIFVDDGGNVGIGTTGPQQKLHVIGSFRVAKDGDATKYMQFRTTGTDVDIDSYNAGFFINYGEGRNNNVSIGSGQAGGTGNVNLIPNGVGNVGVGYYNNAPNKFSVAGDASVTGSFSVGQTGIERTLTIADTPVYLRLRDFHSVSPWAGGEVTGGIEWESNDSTAGTDKTIAEIRVTNYGTLNYPQGTLAFFTNPNFTNLTERMRITHDGNVGIGVTDPDTKLEVFGSTGLKISFDATDNTTLVTDTNGDLTITPSGDMLYLAGKLNLASEALLGSPETGTLEFYDNKFYITNNGKQKAIDRTSDVALETVTVTNTTVETTLWTGEMAANSLEVGNVFRFLADGIVSSASASDTVTVRVRVGGDVKMTLVSEAKQLNDDHWHLEANATQRTLGVSGSRAMHMDLVVGDYATETIAIGTIDTTANMDVTITAQWNNAKAGNTISLYQGFMSYRN